MSDALRQSNTDKAASAMKPDSQKSTLEQATDSVKGTADSAAGSAQPSGDKSVTQQATDAMGGKSSGSKEGESMMDKAKDTLGMNK